MGQRLAATLSCVDCGTQLLTQEDNETCAKIKSRDLKFLEVMKDFSDEISVFESPIASKGFNSAEKIIKINKEETVNKTYYSQISHTEYNYPKNLIFKNTKHYTVRTNADPSISELSTPSIITQNGFSPTRYKAFSSNFSDISLNLVNSVRKTNDLTIKIAPDCNEMNDLKNCK